MRKKLIFTVLAFCLNVSISKASCDSYFSDLPKHQDLIVAFTGAASDTDQNSIQIKINDRVLTENLDYPLINGEHEFKYLVNRNEFNLFAGKQNISLAPRFEELLWGVKDISIKSIPAIPITVGSIDQNTYGYLERSEDGFYIEDMRYTSARFVFNLSSNEAALELSLRASEIDVCDEIAIFVNGSFISNLPISKPDDELGGAVSYSLDSEYLRNGLNVVRFIQRYTSLDWNGFESEKWSIKDITAVPLTHKKTA